MLFRSALYIRRGQIAHRAEADGHAVRQGLRAAAQEVCGRCRELSGAFRGNILPCAVRMAAQDGGKVALAAQAMRPEAEGMLQTGRGIADPVRPRRIEPGSLDRLDGKRRMRVQKGGDDALVFLGRERAGGIDEPPAGGQHFGCGGEDLLLPRGAHGHGRLAPVRHGGLLLPEHALTGAGGVDKDAVKIAGEALGQLCRMLAEHKGVRNAEPLDV